MTALTLTASLAAENASAYAQISPTPTGAATPSTQPVSERPDRVSAALSARLQGSRVLVSGETTESTLTYANPDGTVTLEASSDPVRVKQGEKWTPIDTTLVAADGVFKPKASLADVEFSAGGEGKPFARLERSDKEFYALSWPAALPQPKIEGSKATYTDAAGPGADLVLTALPAGFRHDIILRERPTGSVEYKIPIQAKGLTLTKSEQGTLRLTDAKGKTIASAPVPVMYEGASDQSAPVQPTGEARMTPSRGTLDTEVTSEGGQQFLVLRPSPDFLAAAETRYPVTVDPTVTLGALGEWTVEEPNAGHGGLWVGRNVMVAPSVMERAVINFNTASLVGQPVTNARMELYHDNYETFGCAAGQTVIAQQVTSGTTGTGEIWPGPTTTANGQALGQEPAPCANGGTPPHGWWTWDITGIAKAWATGAPRYGLMLRLAKEGAAEPDYERSFRTSSEGAATAPKLIVTMGSTPSIGATRAAPVAVTEGKTYTSTTTPTLRAAVNAPSGGVLRTEFVVEKDPASGSSGAVWSGSVDGAQSGTEAIVAVPASKLADGAQVRWRARAYDGVDYSEWSAWQSFTVDASPPSPPVFSAGDEFCPSEGSWGEYYDFTSCMVSTASSDAYAFVWGWDDPNPDNLEYFGTGANKSATFEAPNSEGWHTLYVKVRDRAHNTSAMVTRSFGFGPGAFISPKGNSRTQRHVSLVGTGPSDRSGIRYEYRKAGSDGSYVTVPAADVTVPGTGQPLSSWPQARQITAPSAPPRQKGHWALDEGSGTTAADSSGNNHPATLTGATAWGAGKIQGGLKLDGTNGYAATNGAAVHTNASYTVAAWGFLDSTTQEATIVSQDGAVNSAFKLGYSPSDGKWRLITYQSDITNATPVRAVSSQAAVAGRWTHLAGVYDAAAGKIRLYVDGLLNAEAAFTSTWDAAGSVEIGRTKVNGSFNSYFKGTIDDVRVFDRALTVAEIQALASPTADTGRGDFPELSWDMAKTLKAAVIPDGTVELRACLSGGTAAEACTKPIKVTLDQSAFGGSYASADVGPGQVSLQSGDYAQDSTDASLFGIAVRRTHASLNPAADREDEKLAENKVFGPGWRASFPSAPSGIAEFAPTSAGEFGSLQIVGADGSTLSYVKNGTGFTGVGDAADGSTLSATAEQIVHTDATGSKTTYSKVDGKWVVARTETAAEESAVTYYRDGQGRITRILAPVPNGVTCGTTLASGCRALEISYASATTATGVPSGWGDFKDQVKTVSFTAFDLESNAMKTTVLAAYQYDSTGHLRQVTDPRTNLATVYYYNGEGRLSQITPPGLAPWRMEYDSKGRLAHVQREGGDVDPTQAVVYDVPIGGSGAPIDLTTTQTTRWGQAIDLPVAGAAVFPPSHVPARDADGTYRPVTGDWEYGDLTYTDVDGRPVNTAAYGAGAWQVGAVRFSDKGNTVWALTPGNREQALVPTGETDPYVAGRGDSAERANLLATTSTFDADLNLVVVDRPAHPVALADDTLASVRQRTSYTYDEGKPSSSTAYHLVTTTKIEPIVLDGTVTPSAGDVHTVKTGYDPIMSGDRSGWELRKPTSQTIVFGGAPDIVRKMRYDPAGQLIESRMPESGGTDPGTTVNIYYTAAATGPEQCRKAAWAGMPCRTEPKAQPTEGKPLPVIEIAGYTHQGQPTVSTDSVGSVIRTTTSRYDDAGRLISQSMTAMPEADAGTPLPEHITVFDPANGLVTKTTMGGVAVSKGYDTFGRVISYTDADNNTSTTTYDLDGNIATFADGKGTLTYTYDGVDAAGKVERRGLPTKIDSPGVGTFAGAYGADGELVTQISPGGLNTGWRYDNAGIPVGLSYTNDRTKWMDFTNTPGTSGSVARTSGPGGGRQSYTYDTAGRLIKVADTYGGKCTTRVYGFTPNSNRSRLDTYSPDSSGSCSTTGASSSRSYVYDQANRLTSPGYTYDAFGRTTTLPAADVPRSSTDLTLTYYVNDLVASMATGEASRSFALDPEHRVRTTTQTGGLASGTTVNHYGDDSDEPSWIAEAGDGWTRNVPDLSGALAAIQSKDGKVVLQLANMHGDIVATADVANLSSGVTTYAEQTEYGINRDPNASASRYGWLGSNQRATDPLGGILLMGARLYNPVSGRFLQTDPVSGGSANEYDYCNANPVTCTDLDGTIALVDDIVIIGIVAVVLVVVAVDYVRKNPPKIYTSSSSSSSSDDSSTVYAKKKTTRGPYSKQTAPELSAAEKEAIAKKKAGDPTYDRKLARSGEQKLKTGEKVDGTRNAQKRGNNPESPGDGAVVPPGNKKKKNGTSTKGGTSKKKGWTPRNASMY
ncbi:LamG-like jellyroll fold domain-containing protein [Nonomuraea spiralis]|uniref:LamG-like jellyroll fold domain-containing protein n=1 Tax=Nonomuraea spiralis TaxID=46182 RepID=UPI00378B453B